MNPTLNAVGTPLFEKARAAARSPELPKGPFSGVPFLLKDLICGSAGDPLYNGSRLLKSLGMIQPFDTNLAARYRAAGLVFLGKTATPELAQGAHETIKALHETHVLYGGSVKPENAAELMSEPAVDGALVGGASLDAVAFETICRAARAASSDSRPRAGASRWPARRRRMERARGRARGLAHGARLGGAARCD